MQRMVWSVVLASVVLWGAHLKAEDAGGDPLLTNDQIEIEYVKPGEPHLVEIYETMKERQILERLKEFLSPLKLPVKLKITMYECGTTNAYLGRPGEGALAVLRVVRLFQARRPPGDDAGRLLPRRRHHRHVPPGDVPRAWTRHVRHLQHPGVGPRGRCRRSDGRLHHGPVRSRRGAPDTPRRGLCLAKTIRGGRRMAALALFRRARPQPAALL